MLFSVIIFNKIKQNLIHFVVIAQFSTKGEKDKVFWNFWVEFQFLWMHGSKLTLIIEKKIITYHKIFSVAMRGIVF